MSQMIKMQQNYIFVGH